MRNGITLALALSAAGFAPAFAEDVASEAAPALTAAEALFKKVERSVVMVSHETALGSGFAVTPDGYILTNGHVVMAPTDEDPREVAKRITVTLYNEKKYTAKVVGHSLDPDVALIKIDLAAGDESLQPVVLGDSDAVRVGQRCFPFGSPQGLKRTLTAGIVSNIERTNLRTFTPIFQMDAAINHGNSGGPLFNEEGQVIGINTYGIDQGENLGFAIPINVAKVMRAHYLESGRFRRSAVPFMTFQMMDEVMAKALGADGGILVGFVVPGSEAEKAGFASGSVITAIDGVPVVGRTEADLLRFQWQMATGGIGNDRVFSLLRPVPGGEGVRTEITFRLVEDDPAPKSGHQVGEIPVLMYPDLGLGVQRVVMRSRLAYNLPAGDGVLVASVMAGSQAMKAGLTAGDLVTEIEGVKVSDPAAFDAEMGRHLRARKKQIIMQVTRDKSRFPTALAPYYTLAGKRVAVVVPAGDAAWVDLIRRSLEEVGAEVALVGAGGAPAADFDVKKADGVLLAGGAGARAFQDDAAVLDLVKRAAEAKRTVGAIGAGVLALVKGEPELASKKMTVSEEDAEALQALQAKYTGKPVERDGKVVTTTGFDKATVKQFIAAFRQALGNAKER